MGLKYLMFIDSWVIEIAEKIGNLTAYATNFLKWHVLLLTYFLNSDSIHSGTRWGKRKTLRIVPLKKGTKGEN
jgi:hypothetical protein